MDAPQCRPTRSPRRFRGPFGAGEEVSQGACDPHDVWAAIELDSSGMRRACSVQAQRRNSPSPLRRDFATLRALKSLCRSYGRLSTLASTGWSGLMDETTYDRTITERFVVCHFDDKTELVLLCDLSVAGCTVEAPESLRKGVRVAVQLLDNVERAGNVTWLKAGHAGIQFDNSIHPVIVQYLGFRQSAAARSSTRSPERIGRRREPEWQVPNRGETQPSADPHDWQATDNP